MENRSEMGREVFGPLAAQNSSGRNFYGRVLGDYRFQGAEGTRTRAEAPVAGNSSHALPPFMRPAERKCQGNRSEYSAALAFPFSFPAGILAPSPVTVVLEGRSICQRICLHEHANYDTFARALRKMFADMLVISPEFCEGECVSLANAIPGYLIAYEDIEGDLLLAGDLSWKDFVRASKRIRILPVKHQQRKIHS